MADERGGRVYLVEADYAKFQSQEIWTWRRRYFSKQAAEKQMERRAKGWRYEAVGFDDEDMVQEPAVAVRLAVSNPITFPTPEEADHG